MLRRSENSLSKYFFCIWIGCWDPINCLPSIMNHFFYVQEAYAGFEKWGLFTVVLKVLTISLWAFPRQTSPNSTHPRSSHRVKRTFWGPLTCSCTLCTLIISLPSSIRLNLWNVLCYLDKVRIMLSCARSWASRTQSPMPGHFRYARVRLQIERIWFAFNIKQLKRLDLARNCFLWSSRMTWALIALCDLCDIL